MANKIAKLKDVDLYTEHLVIGYIRQIIRIELDEDEIIPSLIISICILFLWMKEYFTIHGEHMILDETLKIIKMKAGNDIDVISNSAYGNIPIYGTDNCIYSWTIKVLKYHPRAAPTVGISASDRTHASDGFEFRVTLPLYKYYAIYSNYTLKLNSMQSTNKYEFGTGDIIKIELNTVNKQIEFFVNNKSRGYPWSDIYFPDNGCFYFTVSMHSIDQMTSSASLELIKFDKIYFSPSRYSPFEF